MADQTQNELSQATKNRLEGVHQIEEKKQEILQIAENLFLTHGIEKTPMTEIAREAGITKATLYRYFPNREEIAVQILIVMLERMMEVLGVDRLDFSIENTRIIIENMIDHFDRLQEALRFIGLFDTSLLNNLYESPDSKHAREQVCRFFWSDHEIGDALFDVEHLEEIIMLTNAVTAFCGTIALRKELYWNHPDIEVSDTMDLFKEMLLGYIDTKLLKN